MQPGIRIQKVLSDNGIMSRRKAEAAITQQRVLVNGRPAHLGQKISPRKDHIMIDGQKIELRNTQHKTYIMLHKPRGYVTTTKDELERKTVLDLIKGAEDKHLYPIGRLDKNSEGLLLLTNDGAFANRIMHPSGEISKTYRVTIHGDVNEEDLIELSTGIVLDDGYKTQPAAIHVLDKTPGRTVLQFTVYEGKNRLIRRMCEAAGLDLVRLKRTAIGPLKLGMLAPGKYRELKPIELEALRGAVLKATKQAEHEKNTQKNARKNKKKGQKRNNQVFGTTKAKRSK